MAREFSGGIVVSSAECKMDTTSCWALMTLARPLGFAGDDLVGIGIISLVLQRSSSSGLPDMFEVVFIVVAGEVSVRFWLASRAVCMRRR